MTIEATATLPAGWYTDPGKSGGKRWWDGIKWTQHLQMPVKVAVASATTRPTANPYGLNGVTSAPRAPMTGENPILTSAKPVVNVNNRSAWLALAFGAAALGLTIPASLPGSQLIWVSVVGVISILWAGSAFARLRSGVTTIAWAPIIGVVLALIATVSVIAGVSVPSVVNATPTSATGTSAAPAALVSLPKTSPEPLVFPANARLTADEKAVQTLATAINRNFAGGNATLASGQSWPTGLAMHGSAVIAAGGRVIATLPAGLVATYQRSADNASYHVAVTVPGTSELATYSTSVNGFSWSCLASDRNCTPAS